MKACQYRRWCIVIVTVLIAATACLQPSGSSTGTNPTTDAPPVVSNTGGNLSMLTPITTGTAPTPTGERTPSVGLTHETSTPTSSTLSVDETLYDQSLHGGGSATPKVASHPTITPIPTLTAAQEGQLLSTLMLTNGGCELPCWWGIHPGALTEEEASRLLQSYSLQWVISDEDFRIISLGYPRIDGELSHIDMNVKLWIDNGIVKYIGVDSGYRREDLRARFIQDWQDYSPAAMVHRFGQPEIVGFSDEPNSPYYRLNLVYGSSGIQVTYMLPFTIVSEGMREVCITLESTDYLYMSLHDPKDVNNLPFEPLSSHPDEHMTWEEVTGLTLDDFATIALNSGCVQLSP